jgi:hypothetical protein
MMADFADTVKKAVDEEAKARELVLPGYRWVSRKNDPVVKNPHSILLHILEKTFHAAEHIPYLPIFDLIIEPEKETMRERDFHRAVQLCAAMVHNTHKVLPIEDMPELLTRFPVYKAALEERPDTRYQAKAPRRGYLEMLEDAMELHRILPPPTSEEEAIESADPTILTETTETPETPAHSDQHQTSGV